MTRYPPSYHRSIRLRTTDLVPHLVGKRTFVAGGRGFFGSWFLDYLEYLRDAEGLDIAVGSGSRRDGWDLTKPETYGEGLLQADYVINCAGSYSPAATQEELMTDHVAGPLALRMNMKRGSTLLQMSSGAAEDPKTLLGDAKAAMEYHLYRICQGTTARTVFVRPFTTVGPGMGLDKHYALSAFIAARLEGRPAEVTATPRTRAFSHITDVVTQSLHVMIHGDDCPYDVGTDDTLTIEEAARLVTDDVRVTDRDFPSLSGFDTYAPNLARVREHFNLEPEMDSRAAVLDTVRYYT